MLEFSRPIWLLLMLALPAMWWLALKLSFASLGPYQRWISLGVRTLVWTLLVFSMAGAQFVRLSDRVSVMVVRDTSDSVDTHAADPALEQLEQARQEMRKDDTLGKATFGSDAYLEFLPLPGVNEEQLAEWQTKPRGNFSDVGEALQLAVASFPDNAQKRLVLLTDGNENIGNALAEARAARDNGVELYVVPLGGRTGPEVVLSSLDAPSRANLGETVKVRFVVQSTTATTANVSLVRNGEFVDQVEIAIKPGKEVYEFPVLIDQSGFFTYELRLEPAKGSDTIADNNRAYTFTVVAGTPRLLYVTGDPSESSYLPRTLAEHNIVVDTVSPGGLPYSLADFQVYDAVILSDVAAYDITDDQMKMMQVLVRDFGRGLMMIGGEKSFGPGGYYDTPVEETLPVHMDFRRKKVTPSTLVVCLVDKSGSMGETVNGVEKVAMAKEACKAVIKLQTERDYVGVMGFDALGQWIVKPSPGIDKEATLQAISSMQAGGGTDLYPALKAAWESSQGLPVQVKHFIVFTDGLVAPNDFEGLCAEMTGDKCTISTVAFGTDADYGFLADLAKLGQGNAYAANSLMDLPKIFTREVFLANKATLSEDPFFAVPQGNSPLVSAIPWGSAPELYGYVVTSAKDQAQVPLITGKEDPLLAVWRYGLGKAAAFTSDAKNRWAQGWLGWGGYERFWTGVARWLRSDLDSGGLDVSTALVGNDGLVRASIVGQRGEFVNYAEVEARVVDPALGTDTVRLRQTGPGEYEGRFKVKDNGNYFINVVQTAAEADGQPAVENTQASGLSVSYSPEYRELDPNTFLLSQLQLSSLAPEGVSLAGLFTEQRKPTRRLEDAWELFTLIALCLWLLDVATRRLVLDWHEWRVAFASVLAGPAGRQAGRTREALGSLLAAKSRAHRPAGGSPPAAPRVIAGGQPDQAAPTPPLASGAVGKIAAPPRPAATAQPAASDGLTSLRQKLSERERTRATPPSTPADLPRVASAKPAPPASSTNPPANLSDREVTNRLLQAKRKREQR